MFKKFLTLIILFCTVALAYAGACDDLKKKFTAKDKEFKQIRKDMQAPGIEKAEYDKLKAKYASIWKERQKYKKQLAECELKNKQKDKYLFNEGQQLLKKGKYKESIAKFDEALKVNPKLEGAYKSAAVAAYKAKDYKLCEKYLEKVPSKETKGKIYKSIATSLKNKKPKQAIAYYKKQAELYHPEEAYYSIGLIYSEKYFDYYTSIDYLKKSLKSKKQAKTYDAIGADYLNAKPNKDNPTKALLNSAIKYLLLGDKLADKEKYKYHYLLCSRIAQAYNQQGKAKSALKYAEKSLAKSKDKNFGIAHLQKGIALKKMGNVPEATKAFNIALKDNATKKSASSYLEQMKEE